MMTHTAAVQKRVGLAYWMQEVLDQCDKVSADFSADPVHDLRTSLRRCRSMADGIMVFDRNPAWKKMRRVGKVLFSNLGELRDTQVMRQWIEQLAPEGDAAGKILTDFVLAREQRLKIAAAITLQHSPGVAQPHQDRISRPACRIEALSVHAGKFLAPPA